MKNTIPKVSIIVPIYNAGQLLYKCLDTLIHQTLKEIEIILVLDCPTDGSDKVAEEYAKKDNRIILIHNKQNLNIGFSRNEGLKIAKGEYIGFSDHDDYRALNMYEILYNEAQKTNADIVYSDAIIEFTYKNKTKIDKYPKGYSNDDFKNGMIAHFVGIDYDDDFQKANNYNCPVYVWSAMYKRKLIFESNPIEFPDNRIMNNEDFIFQIKALLKGSIFAQISNGYYYHWQIHKQNTHKLERKQKGRENVFFRFYKARLVIKEILIKENLWEKYQHRYYHSMLSIAYNGFSNAINNAHGINNKVAEIKSILQVPDVQIAFKIVDKRYIPKSSFFTQFINKLLYDYIRQYLKNKI